MELFHHHANPLENNLNIFIFSALFDTVDYTEQFPELCLFGAGSLLDDYYLEALPEGMRAVAFGSGIARAAMAPRKSLLPEFTRGPVSAAALGCRAIADAAYLIPFLADFPPLTRRVKKHRVSVLPRHRNATAPGWPAIAGEAGVNAIMPDSPTHLLLQAIAESDRLVAGDMYGCILADALRVPWARARFGVEENPEEEGLAWRDWTAPLSLPEIPAIDAVAPRAQAPARQAEALRAACEAAGKTLSLSPDTAYQTVLAQLRDAVAAFSRKYGIRCNTYRTAALLSL